MKEKVLSVLPLEMNSIDRYFEGSIQLPNGTPSDLSITLSTGQLRLGGKKLSDQYVNHTEEEILSDGEIADYNSGDGDGRIYKDASQDIVYWREGDFLRFATTFDAVGPIKLEIAGIDGFGPVSIDYKLTAEPDFAELIDGLGSVFTEVTSIDKNRLLVTKCTQAAFKPIGYVTVN